jgi:hypothetical protein
LGIIYMYLHRLVGIGMYVCIYLSIYLSMYLCIYIFIYLCIYVFMYLCIYISMYLYMDGNDSWGWVFCFCFPSPRPPVGRLSLGIKLSCKIHLLPLPPPVGWGRWSYFCGIIYIYTYVG